MKATPPNSQMSTSCWMPSIPQSIQRLGFALGIIISLGSLIAGFLAFYQISIFAAIGSPISETLLYGGGALLFMTFTSLIIKRCLDWRAEIALQDADYEKRHPKPSKMGKKKKKVEDPSSDSIENTIPKPPRRVNQPPNIQPIPIPPKLPKIWAPLEQFANVCAANDYAPIPSLTNNGILVLPSIQIPSSVVSIKIWKVGFIKDMSKSYTTLLLQGTSLAEAKDRIAEHLKSYNQTQPNESIDIEGFFTNCSPSVQQAFQKFIDSHEQKFLEKLATQAEPFITEELVKHETAICEAIQKELDRYNKVMEIFHSNHPEYGKIVLFLDYAPDVLKMTSEKVLGKRMECLFQAQSFEEKITQVTDLERICPPLKYLPQSDTIPTLFNKLVAYLLQGYPIDFEDPDFTKYQTIKHHLEKIRYKLELRENSRITFINNLISEKIKKELFPQMDQLLDKDPSIILTPSIESKIKNLIFLAEKIPQGETGWAMDHLRKEFNELKKENFHGVLILPEPFNTVKSLIEQIATKLGLPAPDITPDLQEAIERSEGVARAEQQQLDQEAAFLLHQQLNGPNNNPYADNLGAADLSFELL